MQLSACADPCWSLQGVWIGVKYILKDLPGGSAGKESTCSAGDPSSIPGLGRSAEEGIGYTLQYSGLENSMDYIVHGVTKSQTRLFGFHFHFSLDSNHQVSEAVSSPVVKTKNVSRHHQISPVEQNHP